MSRRSDEFSLHISWRRPSDPQFGNRPPVSVPGFHVTAGWANEGEAFYPIDNQRISNSADLTALCRILDAAFNMDGSFARFTDDLVAAHDAAADLHVARMRQRVETLRRQLAEAEAVLPPIVDWDDDLGPREEPFDDDDYIFTDAEGHDR